MVQQSVTYMSIPTAAVSGDGDLTVFLGSLFRSQTDPVTKESFSYAELELASISDRGRE